MRPIKQQKKTERGLGAVVEEQDEPPPPSSRGVTAVPPSEVSPGRYSVRPASTATREFASPVGSSAGNRRRTDRMPAVLDETPRPGSVVDPGATPRRLPAADNLTNIVLGSHETLVLSKVDGQASVQELVVTTALREKELAAVLDRLVRLKLVALD